MSMIKKYEVPLLSLVEQELILTVFGRFHTFARSVNGRLPKDQSCANSNTSPVTTCCSIFSKLRLR